MQQLDVHLSRQPRYRLQLPAASGLTNYTIPRRWEDIPPAGEGESDAVFLEILKKYGYGAIRIPIPLRGRYTRGRRWTEEEFKSCVEAWKNGTSLTLIAAALNRNPQDMIYRLLDYCHANGLQFTEQGRSEGASNWTQSVSECAAELFAAGLPAWKIAALFRVDFEHVEKQVFLARFDYGHKKKNPFGINTRHKYLTNERVLRQTTIRPEHILDAFAGEGKTTAIFSTVFPTAKTIAVETDLATFGRSQGVDWNENVTWINDDNRNVLRNFIRTEEQFEIVDLDPFVTCHEQLELVWPLLADRSLLFVTFGGEYRRSFIGSNRKAIAARYGFSDIGSQNSDYLEVLPYYFLGWVASRAAKNGCRFEVIRAVRYANNCRYWLSIEKSSELDAHRWLQQNVSEEHGGYRFKDLCIPRFSQVRSELEGAQQIGLFE